MADTYPLDELVSATAAARLLPAADGRPVHVSTVIRWIQAGRLWGVRNGRRWYTHPDALRGLFRPAAKGRPAVASSLVERELDALGV